MMSQPSILGGPSNHKIKLYTTYSYTKKALPGPVHKKTSILNKKLENIPKKLCVIQKKLRCGPCNFHKLFSPWQHSKTCVYFWSLGGIK